MNATIPWVFGLVALVAVGFGVAKQVAYLRGHARENAAIDREVDARLAAPLAPARVELTAPVQRPRQAPSDGTYEPRHASREVATTPLSYEPWHQAGRPITGEFAAIIRTAFPTHELAEVAS